MVVDYPPSMDSALSVLRFVGIIFMVLMVFNLMIVVHEWGHFLAARWRGLKVEKFQIWFGKPIWKKTVNGVQYGLGCIPAGGFVALPQMAPMDAIEGGTEESHASLPPISPLDKIIVAFAGPLFSFLLAAVFAVIVFFAGKPEHEADATRILGYVKKDSPASRAGLLPGDEVLSIDGKPVRSFGGIIDSIKWLIVASEGDTINFRVNRPDKGEMTFAVVAEKPKTDPNLSMWKRLFTRPPFRQVGIGPSYAFTVAEFMDDKPNSPAQEAGFQKGDRILSVEGAKVYGPGQLTDFIEAGIGKPLKIEVQRGSAKEMLTITPRLPDQRPAGWQLSDNPLVALGVSTWEGSERITRHPGVLLQLRDAGRTISQTLKAITSTKSDLGPSHLSGAIGIVHSYYNLFQDPAGWQLVLWFSVVLNVNLAILNMLPFPVLDGGHIVMAIMEAIRRRPINLRLLEVVQSACVILLLGFMVFVSFKDTGDLFGASQRPKDGKAQEAKPEPQVEMKFLPEAQRGQAAK
jgi:regulator of sigma E protease